MAKASDSIDVDLSVEDTWSAVLQLARYDEWLILHDGWRGDVPSPTEIGKGTKVSSIVAVKGVRIRFSWVVEKFVPGSEVLLKGSGKGGIKAKLDLSIAPVEGSAGAGSTVTFTIDLGGLPLIGPAGKAAAMAVSGDVKESLANFREVFAR